MKRRDYVEISLVLVPALIATGAAIYVALTGGAY